MIRFRIIFLLIPFFHLFTVEAQVILNADGPGETYELINSVFAPGYDVVEVPDCAHPEFGRHIDEVYDSTLEKYVFRFHIHVTPDNDRCINFDRQRNEIKSYDKSPANLKAIDGETVLYKWKFKIDTGFQSSSSFTHLHQIKAVGGTEESMPLITLTARKGTPDKLEIRYAKNTSQTTIKNASLEPFKGNWVEVEELIYYGESGRYSLNITRLSDSANLISYSNDDIRMWKTGASFLRPKWGIYRSLNSPDDLRDEMIYFSDFFVEELDVTSSFHPEVSTGKFEVYPNPAGDCIELNNITMLNPINLVIIDQTGRIVLQQGFREGVKINISNLENGIYFVNLYNEDNSVAISRLLKQ